MKKRILILSTLICATSFGQTLNTAAPTPLAIDDHTIQNGTFNTKKGKGFTVKSGGTLIWGAGATVGSSDGEFSSSFVNATTYTPGDNPTSWTALAINDNGGATIPGNAYWVQTLTGISQGAYATGSTPISSPSQANGAAIFDSDFLDNGGIVACFGCGASPSAHKGELISPRFDLTGYMDTAIAVNFYSLYKNYAINELSVSLSTDDGTTWSTIDYQAFQPSLSEGFVTVVFPTTVTGVANLTQCRIKFNFDGDYYYAIVDDVSVCTALRHDLTIAREVLGGNGLADAFDQLMITNNKHFPLSQINSHHLMFGANIKNYGYDQVITSDNAQLNVQIEENQSGNWVAVHIQSTDVDTVETNSGTAVVDTLTNSSWASVGDFRTRYTTSLSTDVNTANDTFYHYFSINDNSYASKVPKGFDNKPFASRPIFPGGTDFQSFEYGSMFEFSDATNSNLEIDSVSFRYYVPNAYTGPATTTLAVNVYQFVDGSNGGTADGTLDNDGSELLHIGIGVTNITVAANGSYAVATVTGLIDIATGGAMASLTDGYYFVTLWNNPSVLVAGGPATFDSNTSIWFGASEEDNYALNAAQASTGDVIAHPSPVKVVDYLGLGDWNWVGFGADIVPSIGVHLSGACNLDITTTVNNNVIQSNATGVTYQWIDCNNGNDTIPGATNQSYNATANGDYAVIITQGNCSDTSLCVNVTGVGVNEMAINKIILSPNPTKDNVNIQLGDLKNVNISIVNDAGLELYSRNNINESEINVSLKEFSQGVYFVRIQDQNQRKVVKLIKQ